MKINKNLNKLFWSSGLFIIFVSQAVLPTSCGSSQKVQETNNSSIDTTNSYNQTTEEVEYSEPELKDSIFLSSIHTVLAFKDGFELSLPVIELNAIMDRLVIKFDDFDENIQTYNYEIIHCNADWKPSGLIPSEYLKGMFQSPLIRDYDFSFNTYQDYVHYSMKLPNDDLQFTKSGNYIIKVYLNGDKDDIAFTKRFMVYEDLVDIKPLVKQPTLLDIKNYYQEIDFTITYERFEIKNPFRDINVVLRQNNRWDNAIRGLKPRFMKENELIYNYDEENLFQGGNEFRFVNMKSFRFKTQNVSAIQFNADKKYHVYMKPDIKRPFKIYFTRADINGKFLVKNEDRNDSHLEGDYFNAYFTLPFDFPIKNGNLYLLGAFSDWQFKEDFKLTYNSDKKEYQANLYLKQGFYDYVYVLLENGKTSGDISYIEGSHYTTENDYSIEVYHRDLFYDYDRLVGVQFFNSQNF